jgi:hypothetical protein
MIERELAHLAQVQAAAVAGSPALRSCPPHVLDPRPEIVRDRAVWERQEPDGEFRPDRGDGGSSRCRAGS